MPLARVEAYIVFTIIHKLTAAVQSADEVCIDTARMRIRRACHCRRILVVFEHSSLLILRARIRRILSAQLGVFCGRSHPPHHPHGVCCASPLRSASRMARLGEGGASAACLVCRFLNDFMRAAVFCLQCRLQYCSAAFSLHSVCCKLDASLSLSLCARSLDPSFVRLNLSGASHPLSHVSGLDGAGVRACLIQVATVSPLLVRV